MQRNRAPSLPTYLHSRRWSVDDARAALADLEASGLDLAAFASGAGLDPQRLARWRRRLAGFDVAPAFEEVVLRAAPREVAAGAVEPRERFEVVLVSGRVVRVPATFDEAVLERLLAVVDGGRAC